MPLSVDGQEVVTVLDSASAARTGRPVQRGGAAKAGAGRGDGTLDGFALLQHLARAQKRLKLQLPRGKKREMDAAQATPPPPRHALFDAPMSPGAQSGATNDPTALIRPAHDRIVICRVGSAAPT
ncbi:hypothetical protein TcasGA2_TC002451 [Tribolium castaneum]|uniref:Uncharacterized protein n=1 Tax=Tribolium castaneum TaxID=7070 RepID=D6WI45_TRICA|nr:hypothetical protein TcasGA2_TC002451 [Tribolium castaneum]